MAITSPSELGRRMRRGGPATAGAVATVTTLLAVGLVALLERLLGTVLTAPFMAAIAVSALLAGRRAALLCVGIAAAAIMALYTETFGPATLTDAFGIIRLGTFLLSATAVAFVAGALHSARQQAETQLRQNIHLRELAEDTAGLAEEEAIRAEEEAGRAAAAAEAARVARDELAATLQASPIAICTIDPEGRVRTWNRAAERVFGWASEEVVGRPLANVPDDRQDEFRELRARVLSGHSFSEFETRRVRKDGRELDVLVSTAPLRDREGTIEGLVALYQDVTARKALEAELRQAQKMEAVGQLAAGVAHDFNNVLTVILSHCELLQLEQPTAAAADDIEEIRRAADRAARLTRQLLAFSRRQVLDFEVVNLNDVVRGMQTMLQAAVGDQVRLVTRLDPELTNVRADAHELEQVLLNLAVNARDAMSGGGSLLIETDRVVLGGDHLDPHLGTRSGPHVLLTVTDTGAGMDPATQARIFEPFFTTKPPGRGTGLGLSSAYGVVQQFGGHLSVYSEPGHGTCFRIYLPEHQGPARSERRATPTPIPLHRPVTVLLVDDDIAVRRAVARLLEGSELQVLEAEGPEEAVHLAERHAGPIDLTLSDVAMAGLDGIRLLDRLRSTRPEMRALLMSGYTQEAISRLGKPALAYPLLVKPFTKASLLEAIRQALPQMPTADRDQPATAPLA